MTFERYKRQILIDDIGETGQKKIASARVGVVGAGGLGSVVIPQLIAAGFGTVRIFEGDRLTLTNLNRQTIYKEDDIGKKKAEVLSERLSGMNSDVNIEIIPEFVESERHVKYFKDLDLIIDATDNIEARLLMDRFSQVLNLPLIHGAVRGTMGQVGVFIPPKTITSLYNKSEQREQETPVVAPICGVVGSIEVYEALRIILTGTSPLNGKILLIDLKLLSFREVDIS